MNTTLETQLEQRKTLSLTTLVENHRLLQERYRIAKRRNLDSLPDYSDHCTETFIETINLIKR